MTGSPAAPRSGENTLTVSQSSGSAPGAGGDTGVSRNPDCGGGGPNMAASRTPSQARAGRGAANRRSPTGGWANGMPRKTATPPSDRPRTCPAAVRTTGSVTSMRTSSPAPGPEISGCGPRWPPGRRLRHRVEQEDGNLARRGALLIICEIGHAFLLRGIDSRPLVRFRHPGPDLDGRRAHLDRDIRVREQVAEPLRVARLAAGRTEYRVAVVHLLVDQRVHPFGPALGAGVVQQQEGLALKPAAYLAIVRPEFLDDLSVEVLAVGHGRLPSHFLLLVQQDHMGLAGDGRQRPPKTPVGSDPWPTISSRTRATWSRTRSTTGCSSTAPRSPAPTPGTATSWTARLSAPRSTAPGCGRRGSPTPRCGTPGSWPATWPKPAGRTSR